MTTDNVYADYQKSEARATEKPLTAALSKRRPNFENVRPKDESFRLTVPLDYHPEALGEDDGTIGQAKGKAALQSLWDIHTKLNETAVTIANKAALANQVEPLALKAIKAIRNEIDGLDRQHAHALAGIKAALGSGVGALQAEIRTVLRSMPESERLAFCRELIASGDAESLKAIAAVSPVLTGLKLDEHSYVREEAERLIAPNFVAERDATARARALCQRALDDFDDNMGGNIRRWRSSDDAKIANLVNSLTPKKEND